MTLLGSRNARHKCFQQVAKNLLPRKRTRATPLLRFANTRVAFKYVFDFGKSIDPLDAARAVLKEDVGVAAVGMGRDDIYVAPRFASVSKMTSLLEDLADLQDDGSVRGWVRVLLRRPRLGIDIVRAVLSSGTSEDGPEGESSETWSERTRREAQELRSAVRNAPVLQQVAKGFDELRFVPEYLAELPFCRVQLQSLTLRDQAGGKETYEVDLVLHRSGAAVLTFWWHDGDTVRTVDDLVPLTLGVTGRFLEATMPESVAAAAGWPAPDDVMGSRRHFEQGVWWRTDTFGRPASWTTVAFPYMAAVSAAVGDRDGAGTSWLCYPVIFTGLKDVPAAPVLAAERAQIAAVVARRFEWTTLTDPDELIGHDWSLKVGASVYLNNGAFVAIEYGQSEGLTAKDFDWAGTVDHLLLRFQQARMASRLVLRSAPTMDAVHTAAARVLLNSRELSGPGVVSWGSLQDLVREADKVFGVSAEVGAARERLDLLSRVAGARLEGHRARRNTVLQLVAVVTAVILGLPAINQGVSVIAGADLLPRWLGSLGETIRNVAQDSPANLSVGIWLGIVISVLLVVLLWSIPFRRERLPLAEQGAAGFSGSFPYRWPQEPVTVTIDSPYRDESGLPPDADGLADAPDAREN